MAALPAVAAMSTFTHAQDSAKPQAAPAGKRPVVISSANGLRAVEKAMDMLRAGSDPLDSVVAGINIIEDDPEDMSVGYGGLPNEDGVVELDASCMHGPTCKAGAVAALPSFEEAKNIDPHWSPDGQRLYFIADRHGVSNIYRVELETESLERITRLATGVSGVSRLSPAVSVAAQTGVDWEAILVDNASGDGTVDYVREHYPWVRVVALAENSGFAAGSNAGVRHARGRFVAFLNNDTVADPNWLRTLRDGIDPQVGFLLATSRIVYMHDPSIVDSAGDGVFRWGGAFKRHHGRPAQEAGVSGEVFGVCGAACLMPKAVFDEIGGFDADFFASHEDVDLSYRARLRGYRCWYAADAVVRHHGSATLGRASRFAVFHSQRNLEWVYVKNTPASLLIRTLAGHLIYDAAAAAYFLRHGLLITFLQAKVAAVAGLPAVLRKRGIIQRNRTVCTHTIEEHLERRWLSAKRREKRFDMGLAAGA